MSMICRKTMQPCQTEGMCAPWQGCADPKDAELRRLEAEVAELKRHRAILGGEIERERADKAELLEALKGLVGACDVTAYGAALSNASVLIAKHGGTPKYETTAHVLKFEGEE